MMDFDHEVTFRIMLHLDSLTAFRIRRCCRATWNLLSADNGFRIWQSLVKSTPHQFGLHTLQGGMWLHACIPERSLSMYAEISSTTIIANALRFTDNEVVEGVVEAAYKIRGIFAAQSDSFLKDYLGEGQHFFGSWMFNAASVQALICGDEPGPVRSSLVEFQWMQVVQCRGSQPGNFNFGVLLTLARTEGGRFVLSWQPQVMNTAKGLLQEDMDLFDVHLHGHLAAPYFHPLGWEGNVSILNPFHMQSSGHHTTSPTLSKTDALKLLEHECLICALSVRFFYMGKAASVTTAMACELEARAGELAKERDDSEFLSKNNFPQQLQSTGSKIAFSNCAICLWHVDHRQHNCPSCLRAMCAKVMMREARA